MSSLLVKGMRVRVNPRLRVNPCGIPEVDVDKLIDTRNIVIIEAVNSVDCAVSCDGLLQRCWFVATVLLTPVVKNHANRRRGSRGNT